MFNSKKEKMIFAVGLTCLLLIAIPVIVQSVSGPPVERVADNQGIDESLAVIMIVFGAIGWVISKIWPYALGGFFFVCCGWWLKDLIRDAIGDALDDYFVKENLKETIKEAIQEALGGLSSYPGGVDLGDLKEVVKEAVDETLDERRSD